MRLLRGLTAIGALALASCTNLPVKLDVEAARPAAVVGLTVLSGTGASAVALPHVNQEPLIIKKSAGTVPSALWLLDGRLGDRAKLEIKNVQLLHYSGGPNCWHIAAKALAGKQPSEAEKDQCGLGAFESIGTCRPLATAAAAQLPKNLGRDVEQLLERSRSAPATPFGLIGSTCSFPKVTNSAVFKYEICVETEYGKGCLDPWGVVN